MRINENNNSINKPATEQNSTQTENKEKNLSLFNILNKEEKARLDKNQDGKISFQEVKDYINSGIADSKILNKLANLLGIEVKKPTELSNNLEFKQNANELLDAMEKIDTNNDEEISLQEIRNAKNLTKTESIKLHKTFGLVDGEFSNQQGRFGSCWALAGAYGICITDKEKFNKIIKQDEDGNAIVTFYGISNEPFQTKIDRRIIQNIIKMRTKTINYNTLNKENGILNELKYYSSDPDGIAIELAFQNYNEHIDNLRKEHTKKILDYINNSTPIIPQKPDINNISLEMSNEDLKVFLNYYKNSTSDNKDKYIFPYDIDYLTPEIINDMKNYIESSTPTGPEKPTREDIRYNTNKILNYIKNSTSDTKEKPKVIIFVNPVGTIVHGGSPGKAIKMMAGGTCETYSGTIFNSDTGEYDKISKDEKNKIKKLLQNYEKNNQIFSISFEKTDKKVYANHAYTMIKSDDKNIYLVNPHNTEAEPIIYPIKKAINNLGDLEINNLPVD